MFSESEIYGAAQRLTTNSLPKSFHWIKILYNSPLFCIKVQKSKGANKLCMKQSHEQIQRRNFKEENWSQAEQED